MREYFPILFVGAVAGVFSLIFLLARMARSVWVSTAETESSRIRMGAFFIRARAMEMRCFCPPGTLRDVSFTIRAGQRVGIVGRTGSGKTTVVDLILRTWRSASGRPGPGWSCRSARRWP